MRVRWRRLAVSGESESWRRSGRVVDGGGDEGGEATSSARRARGESRRRRGRRRWGGGGGDESRDEDEIGGRIRRCGCWIGADLIIDAHRHPDRA